MQHFISIVKNLNSLEDLICNSPYFLLFNSYDISLDTLILNELIIPYLIFFLIFFLIFVRLIFH